jgi:acetylornithine deacetylase
MEPRAVCSSSTSEVPTVVCGPGSITQAHKPDEFVTIDQMQCCDAMLDRLLNRLCATPHDLEL